MLNFSPSYVNMFLPKTTKVLEMTLWLSYTHTISEYSVAFILWSQVMGVLSVQLKDLPFPCVNLKRKGSRQEEPAHHSNITKEGRKIANSNTDGITLHTLSIRQLRSVKLCLRIKRSHISSCLLLSLPNSDRTFLDGVISLLLDICQALSYLITSFLWEWKVDLIYVQYVFNNDNSLFISEDIFSNKLYFIFNSYFEMLQTSMNY